MRTLAGAEEGGEQVGHGRAEFCGSHNAKQHRKQVEHRADDASGITDPEPG